ncbi:hypothetical protein GG344DRAFT_74853 [Lentinula edodes]|nr:hypothetical protein GG344DRAFT_74853 [Lentinula edodes]
MSSRYSMDVKPLSQKLSDSIPIEIHEYIISHVDSTSTLKNCSLTCRAWLRASWRNLFSQRRIVVDRTNFESFLEIIELDSLSVTIIRFIRSLHIEQGESWLLYRSTGPRNPKTFQFDDYLQRLVGLVSVKSLRLGGIRRDIGPPTIAALRHNFAGVSVLEIHSVVLASAEQFLDILSSFPSLSGLVLGGVAIDSLSEVQCTHDSLHTLLPPHTPPVPTTLTELVCNLPQDETIFLFSWLTLHGTVSIRKLDVTLIHELSNAAVSKYLRDVGPSVEELTIGSADINLPDDFTLSPCVMLSTLGISVQFRSRSNALNLGVPPTECFIPLVKILQTISAKQLKEVNIWLRPNGHMAQEEYEQLDWDGLASVIEQPLFKSLFRFRFFASSKHVEIVKRVIKKRIWEEHPLLAPVVRVRARG